MSSFARQESEAQQQDDESIAEALWLQMVALVALLGGKMPVRGESGGSVPGKVRNVARDFVGAHVRYMVRCFWPSDHERSGTAEREPSKP